MPIYVWKCETCGTLVEELRKMGDDTPPETCGKCGNSCECGESKCQLKKVPTAASFVMK